MPRRAGWMDVRDAKNIEVYSYALLTIFAGHVMVVLRSPHIHLGKTKDDGSIRMGVESLASSNSVGNHLKRLGIVQVTTTV